MRRLTVYGRADCPLCHEMRAVIDQVIAGRPGFVVEEIDVDTDAALARTYGHEVPVLCIDGRRAFAGHVTPAALAARLVREGA
jgi:glutaredoxin